MEILKELYITKLSDNLIFIGLELYGQMYFQLERKDIEICYTNNINLFTYWVFVQSLPICGKLIIKEPINEDDLKFIYINDIVNIWNVKTIDIPFFDKRIKKENYLRCEKGVYEIYYGV